MSTSLSKKTTCHEVNIQERPSHIQPYHWHELVVGSGINPAIASLNFSSIEGEEVLELLAGEHLESLGGHANQYATAPVRKVFKTYETATEGGWRDCGLDPQNRFKPIEYGRFKPDNPRTPKVQTEEGLWVDADGPLKYEGPRGVPFRAFYPRVTVGMGYEIAKSLGKEESYVKRFEASRNKKRQCHVSTTDDASLRGKESGFNLQLPKTTGLTRRERRAIQRRIKKGGSSRVDEAFQLGLRPGKGTEHDKHQKDRTEGGNNICRTTSPGFIKFAQPSDTTKGEVPVQSSEVDSEPRHRIDMGLNREVDERPEYINNYSKEEDTGFWQWLLSILDALIVITEGSKKAAALVSCGIPAIAIPGITMWHRKGEKNLHPDLLPFCTQKRPIAIVLDQDSKPKTRRSVNTQIRQLGDALESAGCKVSVASWPQDWGKGVDDVLVSQGDATVKAIISRALSLKEYNRNSQKQACFGVIHLHDQLSYPIERSTEGEYMPPLPALSPGAIHVVDANMNSGKTYRIGLDWVQDALTEKQHKIREPAKPKQQAKDTGPQLALSLGTGTKPEPETAAEYIERVYTVGWKHVLVLAPLNSLGEQTAKDWKGFHIHEQGKNGKEQREFWEAVKARPAVVMCPDSIAKVPEWFWSEPVLLIVDEGNQVTDHICQGDTLKSRYAPVLERIRDAAQHAIQSGGSIVLSEDGIPDRAVKFWQTISGATSVRCFHHHKKGVPWDCTVYTRSLAGFRGELLKQVKSERRFLFVSSSQREAKRLEKIARAAGRKVVRIDGETNQNGAFKLFFKAPDEWLYLNQPDILILSPSAKSGVSIEGKVSLEDAYFESVWGYFPCLSTDTHMQLLGRYRPSAPRHLFVPPIIQSSSDERLRGARAIAKRLRDNVEYLTRIFELQETRRENTVLEEAITNYLADARAVSGAQKQIAQEALIARLRQAGHTVATQEMESDRQAARLWTKTQDEIWHEEAAETASIRLEEFQTLDWAYRTLDSMESSAEDRKAAYKVLWRDQFPGVLFDDPEECYEALHKDYGRMRRGALLQAQAQNLDATKQEDTTAAAVILNYKVRPSHKLPRNYVKAGLMAGLGILEMLDGRSWSNSDEIAIAIKEKAIANAQAISNWLRLTIKQSQTPSEIINKLLKKIGLDAVSIGRPGARGKQKDRIYAIENLRNPIREKLLKAASEKLSGSVSTICIKDSNTPMQIVDTLSSASHSEVLREWEWRPGDLVTWSKRGVTALVELIQGAIATIGDESGQVFKVPIEELVPMT